MNPIARLERATVDLGRQRVLDGVDFELPSGHVAGVTGPNGAGKTTLLRALGTLVRLDGGAGTVLGVDISTDAIYGIRRSIGLLGHSPTLLDHLTLRENLVHATRLAGLELDRVDRALHSVGLEKAADRQADASSFGMKRRLEVARLLLTRPRLLLVDEATAGLDSDALDLIEALVGRTVEAGGGVVMVSHDRSQLAGLCNGIARLSFGQLEMVS